MVEIGIIKRTNLALSLGPDIVAGHVLWFDHDPPNLVALMLGQLTKQFNLSCEAPPCICV